MLRNGAKLMRSALCTKCQRGVEFSNQVAVHRAKNTALQRQGKIMSKLFGNRVSGSKKRWYPTQEGSSATSQNLFLGAAQLGKSSGGGGGKNTSRRMVVLNKLFMKHISDLLATGEASEAILGCGLQIQRVKISPDFMGINVYWLGSGDSEVDNKLEVELQRCSGVLRHELSQLALMGEVPRIKFVRDKTLANLTEVNALLQNMVFSTTADDHAEVEGNAEQQSSHENAAFTIAKKMFFGQALIDLEEINTLEATSEACVEAHLPEMRHDVLGLDHHAIMSKILTKMRKSKQAWDLHIQQQFAVSDDSRTSSVTSNITATNLERMNRKLAEATETAVKFDKFLAKRSERKNTPERKKYRAYELLDSNDTTEDTEGDGVLSTQQRRLLHEEDYLLEEYEGERQT